MARNNKIFELIPQREPMVMVDKHISTVNNVTLTRFTVETDSMFIENNSLSEAGIIENIAQSAAAHSGFLFKQSGSGESPVGFIATIQELQINFFPEVGNILQTEIKFLDEVLGVSIIEGTVFINNDVVANCKMKIFLKK
jgi:3-hydroxymyristoyl/3-hydroxydecanoyl-(acyl carrier protein) dehydratase